MSDLPEGAYIVGDHEDNWKRFLSTTNAFDTVEKDYWSCSLVDLSGETALHHAVRKGRLSYVKWLVEIAGVDVEHANQSGEPPLYIAATNGHLFVVQWLIKQGSASLTNGFSGYSMSHAAQKGYLHVMEWLDKNGAAISRSYCQKLLRIAAHNGHLHIYKWLVNQHNASVNYDEDNGFASLSVAVIAEQWHMVKWLVNEGAANVNQIHRRDGSTPLSLAAQHGNLPIVKLLVEKGVAGINQLMANNSTPLHLAARNGHLTVVIFLIQHCKASFSACNANGLTPFACAIRGNHVNVVEWMISHDVAQLTKISIDDRIFTPIVRALIGSRVCRRVCKLLKELKLPHCILVLLLEYIQPTNYAEAFDIIVV